MNVLAIPSSLVPAVGNCTNTGIRSIDLTAFRFIQDTTMPAQALFCENAREFAVIGGAVGNWEYLLKLFAG